LHFACLTYVLKLAYYQTIYVLVLKASNAAKCKNKPFSAGGYVLTQFTEITNSCYLPMQLLPAMVTN